MSPKVLIGLPKVIAQASRYIIKARSRYCLSLSEVPFPNESDVSGREPLACVLVCYRLGARTHVPRSFSLSCYRNSKRWLFSPASFTVEASPIMTNPSPRCVSSSCFSISIASHATDA